MSKIPKIAVSFLLILSIILNPFASALDIRASASGTAVAFGTFVVDFIINQIIFQAGNQMWQYSIENPDKVANSFKYAAFSNFENFITATDVVQVEYDIYQHPTDGLTGTYKPTGFYLDPTVVLSDEQREAYQLIVDTCNEYIAEGGDTDLVMYQIGDAYGFDPIGYEELKTNLTNKFIQKSLDDSVAEAGQAGILPIYNFDFVGPLPSIAFPVSTGMSTLMKDGFVHTIPYSSDSLVNGRFATAEAAESYSKGLDNVIVNGSDTQGYYFTAAYTGYSGGRYILYNGVAYYARSYSYTPGAIGRSCSSGLASVREFINFVDVNGNTLASVYTGGAYAQGIYYNKTGEVALDRPQVTTIDDSEFTTTTGGGTVEIPRTEEEDIIGQAIGLGLINPDSALELNEDGTIAGADGMTLAKLQELIDMIASGNLQFENIQEYLDLITKLVASGNYTATEQKVILENIEALNQASAKSLEEINAAVLAISQALTLEGELEDVETEFSYLDVEHTGLIEAETIVNTALPIVGQAKQLVGNVFNSVSDTSKVPNFNFYWDSNGDGVTEKYTALDLSFMEQTLTNENLEDKSRFTEPMTVREFVQYLIVFICYAVFLVKLLRRIPAILGGSEGMSDDISTISKHS